MTRALRLLAAALALVALAVMPSASRAAEKPPRIGAPAAILVEPATGDVVFQRNANKRRLIASTTKMMTALIAVEKLAPDDVLAAVDYNGAAVESMLGLRAGQKMTARDYLRALLLDSANDAAATLAVRVAGSTGKFVAMMNAKARAIGLKGTRFANPIGLDADGNYSTASDLAKLALVLRENATLRADMNLRRATVQISGSPRSFANRNTLVDDYGFVNGVKTGHTNAAGYILVGSGTRNGVSVVSVVLGEPSEAARNADSLALLRYGTRVYHVVTGVKEGQPMARADLRYRDGQSVPLVASRTVRRTVKRGEKLAVRVVGAPSVIDGPLPQGARVGTIEVRQRGRVVQRVALVTATTVSAATATQRLGDYLTKGPTLIALALLVICSLVLVLLRRRVIRRPASSREVEAA